MDQLFLRLCYLCLFRICLLSFEHVIDKFLHGSCHHGAPRPFPKDAARLPSMVVSIDTVPGRPTVRKDWILHRFWSLLPSRHL
ncbi:hypothetical protein RIF29_38010 [Crotalaria pallida]|uniref:Secreted protein n=1 Tax=Crotalaria pallida TaxID=3830 RepID=A0AAN9E3X2_CROPI